MGKIRDLWGAPGERAVSAPQPVRVARGWDVRAEVLPAKPQAPRRRKYAPVKPNNRDAVTIPHPGQSYNPVDEDHQLALQQAVRQLQKKKTADEKYVAMMTQGRDMTVTGNFSADKTWEEEVQERPQKKQKKNKNNNKEGGEGEAAVEDKKKKNKQKKKKNKSATKAHLQAAKRALPHRRHPKREIAIAEADKLDDILAAHQKKEAKRAEARAKRREIKKAKLQIKNFGRHYHTPLALDVAPSSKLVGSLRHVEGGYVHPVLDRMKSLEERNLVPARMRHKYNKRKILKPKGEVRIKRETFGVLPETSF